MKKIILIVLIFITTSVRAQIKPVASIPFTTEKNCIYFYSKVNGTDSIKFLFDTGADGSVINRQSLGKLRLKVDGKSLNTGSNGTNEVENSLGNEVVLGTIKKKNVSFTIIPYDSNAFDGVFGADLMKGYLIEIDYHKQVLNFYAEDEKAIDYKGYTKLKLHFINNYPTVESAITIDNKKYTGFFGLDTGADDALTVASVFSKKNDFISKMPKIGSAGFQGSDGSAYEMPIMLCPELQFAGKLLYRIPISLSNATEGIDASHEIAGFYGNSLLKKFNIIIDFKNQDIYFKLNKNLYTAY